MDELHLHIAGYLTAHRLVGDPITAYLRRMRTTPQAQAPVAPVVLPMRRVDPPCPFCAQHDADPWCHCSLPF